MTQASSLSGPFPRLDIPGPRDACPAGADVVQEPDAGLTSDQRPQRLLVRVVRAPALDTLRAIQLGRGEVYRQEALDHPQNFETDGSYVDEDDPYSLHICASTEGGELVGALKLTPRLPGTHLKLEACVPRERLTFVAGTSYGEYCRLFVRQAYRNAGIGIVLWQASYRAAVDHGIDEVYALQRDGVLLAQERYGIPVERLGDQLIGQGDLALTPTRLVISDFIPALLARDPKRAWFFATPLPDGPFDQAQAMHPAPRLLEEFVRTSRNTSLEH